MPLAFNSKSTNISLKFVPPEQYVFTSKIKVGTTPVVDKNKKTKHTVQSEKKPKVSPKELAQMLFNQISGPSLNKNTIALLNMVTKENVSEVITEYQKLSKNNTLMKDIDEEWGLDINTVKEYLTKKLIDQAKTLKIDLTGIKPLSNITTMDELEDVMTILTKIVFQKLSMKNTIAEIRQENSIENIKKQYTPDKYDIKTDENSCIILTKDGTKFKEVYYYDNKAACIILYNSHGQIVESYGLDDNSYGKSNYFYDSEGKLLKKEITSYNEIGTISSYIIMAAEDKPIYGNSRTCSYPPLIDSKYYEVKNNQIKNENYTGDIYDIKFVGYKATIINKTKQQTTELDIAKLLDNKYMNEEDKTLFFQELKTLPGEVLADLAIECNFIGNRRRMTAEFNKKEYEENGKYYSKKFNTAGIAYYKQEAMLAEPDATVIIHELGHLLSICKNGIYFSNGEWETEYNQTFERENEVYLQYLKENSEAERHYCSENPREFFAEIYTYLMLGYTGKSDDSVIKKFFPESFKMVKAKISEIRQMKTDERNNFANIPAKTENTKSSGFLSKLKAKCDNYFSRLCFGEDNYNVNNTKRNLYLNGVYRTIDNTY